MICMIMGDGRLILMESGFMNASLKRFAVAVGVRRTIGIILVAVLVAVAANGWEKTNARARAASQIDSTIGSGHYKLQPLW
jgi:hypothetical protein